jgi:hypothetical protein
MDCQYRYLDGVSEAEIAHGFDTNNPNIDLLRIRHDTLGRQLTRRRSVRPTGPQTNCRAGGHPNTLCP